MKNVRFSKYIGKVFIVILIGGLAWAPAAFGAVNPALEQALALSKKEQWMEAIPHFRTALKADPGNILAKANLGVALSRVDRHKEALLAFDEALNKGYDSAQFRYYRGLSFLHLRLLEEAAREMETALKLNPLMPETLYDLGLVYTLQGRTADARGLVKKLYRRNYQLAKKLFHEIPPEYKIASVANGGTLTGRVTLTGPVPDPRFFHLIHSPNIEFCSRISDGKGHRILRDFKMDPQGGLKDTVIAIQGVAKGKPFPAKMKVLRLDRCRASQYVIGLQNGEEFLIENTDPFRHEIATYQFHRTKVRQTSNKPVTAKSSQVRSAFVKPGSEEFTIKCNLHPFLQTQGLFVSNPYFAVTDASGRFQIPDIPPGTYDVLAWHPLIPSQHGRITVAPEGRVTLDFSFAGESVRRKLYQNDTKGYRFNTWYDSGEKFYGGKRVDDPVEILQEFDNSARYREGDAYFEESVD